MTPHGYVRHKQSGAAKSHHHPALPTHHRCGRGARHFLTFQVALHLTKGVHRHHLDASVDLDTFGSQLGQQEVWDQWKWKVASYVV